MTEQEHEQLTTVMVKLDAIQKSLDDLKGIPVELVKQDTRIRDNEKAVDELRGLAKGLSDRLEGLVSHHGSDMSEIKNSIDELKRAPADAAYAKSKMIRNYILTAVLAALVSNIGTIVTAVLAHL